MLKGCWAWLHASQWGQYYRLCSAIGQGFELASLPMQGHRTHSMANRACWLGTHIRPNCQNQGPWTEWDTSLLSDGAGQLVGVSARTLHLATGSHLGSIWATGSHLSPGGCKPHPLLHLYVIPNGSVLKLFPVTPDPSVPQCEVKPECASQAVSHNRGESGGPSWILFSHWSNWVARRPSCHNTVPTLWRGQCSQGELLHHWKDQGSKGGAVISQVHRPSSQVLGLFTIVSYLWTGANSWEKDWSQELLMLPSWWCHHSKYIL